MSGMEAGAYVLSAVIDFTIPTGRLDQGQAGDTVEVALLDTPTKQVAAASFVLGSR